MSHRFESYSAERDRLLKAATDFLEQDKRFVAAWLGESLGRNNADQLSDLDLFVAVANEYSDIICQRQRKVTGETTDERLAIISQIGHPVAIHENHNNAPDGASFTVAIYDGTAQQVDWTMIPQVNAHRHPQSLLLFEKVAIPTSRLSPPETPEERTARLKEKRAFFWMMTVPTTKYALRGDSVYFHILLDTLCRTVADIERLLRGDSCEYQRGSSVSLAVAEQDQIKAVRELCSRMATLEPKIEAYGIELAPPPMNTISVLLSLSEDTNNG